MFTGGATLNGMAGHRTHKSKLNIYLKKKKVSLNSFSKYEIPFLVGERVEEAMSDFMKLYELKNVVLHAIKILRNLFLLNKNQT